MISKLKLFANGATFFGVSFALLGCGGAPDASGVDPSAASSTDSLLAKCPPPAPDPSLVAPDGNRLAFQFDGIGVQIYTCQATATGYGWVFKAPEATLYSHGVAVGKHYAGPTWEFLDHSKVVATKIAGFTPDPSAIPWLLLQASSHEGRGLMSNVTYIQRFDTTGGLAPASGCDADHVGSEARVDYTATYLFYDASKAHPCACR